MKAFSVFCILFAALLANAQVTADAGVNKEICLYDTLTLTGSGLNPGDTGTYSWQDLNSLATYTNTNPLRIAFSDSGKRRFVLTLEKTSRGITYTDQDTVDVLVNALPSFVFSAIPPFTYDMSPFGLTANTFIRAYSGDRSEFESDLHYFHFKSPSWISGGPPGVKSYVYEFGKYLRNDQIPKTGLRDSICAEYTDYKGCYNTNCKAIIIYPVPEVVLQNSTYAACRDTLSISAMVQKPIVKTGGIETFNCLSVPTGSGLNADSVIRFNALTKMHFLLAGSGNTPDPKMQGEYAIQYCFRDYATNATACDTAVLKILAPTTHKIDLPDTLCASVPMLMKTKTTLNGPGVWTGMGVTGNMLDPSFSPQINLYEGPYVLYFAFNDTASKCNSADTLFYRIQSAPEAKIVGPDTFRMCEGGLLQLYGNFRYAQNCLWQCDGDGVFYSPASLQTTYQHGRQDTAKGLVTLYLYAISHGACPAAADSLKLAVEAYPQFVISTRDPVQCEPAWLNFKALVRKPLNTALQYSWWFGNGDSLLAQTADSVQNIRYDQASPSFYNVRLQVSRRWGSGQAENCTVTLDSTGLVKVLPQPRAGFYASPGFFTTISSPEFKFTNTTSIRWGADQMRYHWQFSSSGKDTSTSKHPFFRYKPDTGIYHVTLQAMYLYSENGTSYACTDELTRILKIGLPVDCIKILDQQLLNRSIQVYFPFEGHFRLINAAGRTVISKYINASLTESMDISDWPPGVYTFYIYNGKKECARKFIKY